MTQTQASPPSLSRVVVARTDLLGELVLSLAMARRLREACSGIAVTMIVAPGMGPLVGLCPDVAAVIEHAHDRRGAWWSRAWRLGRRLRRGAYEAIFVMNPTKALHLAAWAAGIPVRAGYACKGGRWLLTNALPDGYGRDTAHEQDRGAALLQCVGLDGPMPDPRLVVGEETRWKTEPRRRAWGLGPAGRLLALHPWASKPFKRWPLDRFLAVARPFAEAGWQVVVVGGAEHAAESRALPDWTVNLTGRTTLEELAAVLAQGRLLLSNDTGPAHVAAALGVPTVVLFGTTDPAASPKRWAPRGPAQVVISRPTMAAISIEEVQGALRASAETWTEPLVA